jgi:hypothetical protein
LPRASLSLVPAVARLGNTRSVPIFVCPGTQSAEVAAAE